MKSTRSYTQVARAEGTASTRDTIIRTAHTLFFEQAYEDVTLAEIAKASGVSHQTVLNHFESKVGVLLAVAEHAKAEIASTRDAAVAGDVAGAIHVLVGDYEQMGDANFRWNGAAARIEELAAILAEARVSHQEWLVTMFGDRLATTAAARKQQVLALHAATDSYTWKLLRRDLGCTRAQTEKTIVDLVVGILEGTAR